MPYDSVCPLSSFPSFSAFFHVFSLFARPSLLSAPSACFIHPTFFFLFLLPSLPQPSTRQPSSFRASLPWGANGCDFIFHERQVSVIESDCNVLSSISITAPSDFIQFILEPVLLHVLHVFALMSVFLVRCISHLERLMDRRVVILSRRFKENRLLRDQFARFFNFSSVSFFLLFFFLSRTMVTLTTGFNIAELQVCSNAENAYSI